MRILSIGLLLTVLAAGLWDDANAQGQSLASTMDVYVFPAEGQEASQQSKDEARCGREASGRHIVLEKRDGEYARPTKLYVD